MRIKLGYQFGHFSFALAQFKLIGTFHCILQFFCHGINCLRNLIEAIIVKMKRKAMIQMVIANTFETAANG